MAVSAWTLDTLRIHLVALIEEKSRALEAKIQEQKEAIQIALAAQKEQVSQTVAAMDRAVTKAETSSDKRFEGVNEFRNTLADQQRTLMPRQEIEVIVGGINERIAVVSASLTRLDGRRSGIGEGWGWAVGAIGLVTAVAAIILGLR